MDKSYFPHTAVLEGPREGRPMAGSRHSLTYNPYVYKACTWTHTTNGHRHEYMEISHCSQTHTYGHIMYTEPYRSVHTHVCPEASLR